MENRDEAEQRRGLGLGGDPLSPGQPRAKMRWVEQGFGCESQSLGGPRPLRVTEGHCQEKHGNLWGILSIVLGRVWGLVVGMR